MSRLFALIPLLLVASAPLGGFATSGTITSEGSTNVPPFLFEYTADSTSGIAVFSLHSLISPPSSDSARLYVTADFTISGDNRPVAAFFLDANGTVTPFRNGLWWGDNSMAGPTSHAAYANVAGTDVHNPWLGSLRPGRSLISFTPSSGYLVLLWAAQLGPIEFKGVANNMTATLFADSKDASTFGTYDFHAPANAGVTLIQGAHAILNGELAWHANKGDQLFSFIRYYRGETASVGHLDIRSDTLTERFSLNADDSMISSCACLARGTVIATSEDNLDVAATFVAEGRTQVFGIVARLPATVPLRMIGISSTFEPGF